MANLTLLLVLPILLTFVSAGNYSSRSDVSYIREKPKHLPHLLQRQKRWLIFELGTSITLTANCAKALLDTIPRGLVLLAEATSIYDMPGSVADWLPRRKHRPKTTPPPPPPPPPPPALATQPKVLPAPVIPLAIPYVLPEQPVIVPLSPADPIHSLYLSYPQVTPILGHRKSYANNIHSTGCPASNLVKDAYGNYYCRPTTASRRLRREMERNGANFSKQGQSPHGMLFDLLIMLSELHQYQPRYCIMRTLCESRHLLAAPGQSLFHDIFRILLRYVHPEIAHKPTYRKAFTAGHTLHECAQWYGAHCPQSFLLHFSKHFQSKFAH